MTGVVENMRKKGRELVQNSPRNPNLQTENNVALETEGTAIE